MEHYISTLQPSKMWATLQTWAFAHTLQLVNNQRSSQWSWLHQIWNKVDFQHQSWSGGKIKHKDCLDFTPLFEIAQSIQSNLQRSFKPETSTLIEQRYLIFLVHQKIHHMCWLMANSLQERTVLRKTIFKSWFPSSSTHTNSQTHQPIFTSRIYRAFWNNSPPMSTEETWTEMQEGLNVQVQVPCLEGCSHFGAPKKIVDRMATKYDVSRKFRGKKPCHEFKNTQNMEMHP